MRMGLRIFLVYALFIGLTGYFVLNTVMKEIRPGVRQSTEETRWGDISATAASGPIEKLYPLEWDELGQLGNNMTPNHGLAFPSGAFKVLNFRFSETLTTIEDWDLIVRMVNVLGVASSPEITSIYRWWDSAESSRTLHSDREWARNRQEIMNRLNSQPILLEAGSADLISDLRQHLADQVENQKHLRDHISLALKELETLSTRALAAEQALAAGGRLGMTHDAATESSIALARLIEILESTSWRLTGPWRSLRRLLTGRRPVSAKDYVGRDAAVIEQAINDILASRAWRATSVVRKLRGG